MRCPVCKQQETMYWQPSYGAEVISVQAPLYQISYKGEKEYVSERCSACIEKVLRRRIGKL